MVWTLMLWVSLVWPFEFYLNLAHHTVCSSCDFKARSGTALRNHSIMKHAERKFQCFLCSKKFGSKQNLEQHGVVHTGMTSWHCSDCEMSFKRHHHFKAHLQRFYWHIISIQAKLSFLVQYTNARFIPFFVFLVKVTKNEKISCPVCLFSV